MTPHSDDRIIVLVVRDVTVPEDGTAPVAGVSFCRFAEVAERITTQGAPALVISALSGKGFDAVDLARVLNARRFSGVYYAVTPPLPAPDVIKSEIARVAPGLMFDLLTPADLALLKRTGLP